jgi:hypothetical protein
VDEVEWLPRPIFCLLRERNAVLLPCEARVAELVGVIYVRETTHESTVRHPLHPVKVLVPESRMPALDLGHFTYGKAHWANRGEGQHVQMILRSFYPDEKALMPIMDGEHSMVDIDVTPALIELYKADHAALERGDV